jgi:hypothetical protein
MIAELIARSWGWLKKRILDTKCWMLDKTNYLLLAAGCSLLDMGLGA